jgi:transglutaminase-like putative cysteine protease
MKLSMLATACSVLLVSCIHPPHSGVPEGAKSFRATVSHSFQVTEVPAGAKEMALWVPLPPETAFQKVSNLKVTPAPDIRTDPTLGNRVAFLSWKAPIPATLEVGVSYELERFEESAHRETLSESNRSRFLESDRLGLIDARIKSMSDQATAGKQGTMAKARALYDFVLAHMTYDKVTPGWGRGDVKRACDTPAGNCSDYHSLFIALARAAGIPARFHYGYSIQPGGKIGAHCWAQFFDEEKGWVPVDISEADKDPSKTEYFFGRLNEKRVVYTTGRDLILDPKQKGDPLNFLIDPYIEIDGKPAGKVTAISSHSGSDVALAR